MKKEKKIYEIADVEVILLTEADVISTSGWGLGGDKDDNTDPGGWT